MLKKILKAKMVSVTSLLALLLLVAGFLWSYFALKGVAGSPLIVHFNDIEGITAVGPFADIAGMGVLGLVIIIMNFFIAIELDLRDQFLGKFIAAFTLVFSVLLFIAFAAIINVN